MATAVVETKRKPEIGGKAAAAGPLSPEQLRKLHAYWRAANYLSVGQIYLMENPLLKEPLQLKHVKPRLLGHWGTTSGQNFLYVHLNRVIRARPEHALCLRTGTRRARASGRSPQLRRTVLGHIWGKLGKTPSVEPREMVH